MDEERDEEQPGEGPEQDPEPVLGGGSEDDGFWWRAYDWFQKYRRRLSFVVLVVFLAAVALEIGGAVPREVRLSYNFPDHGVVTEANIVYSQESESVREVRLQWPDGAPREVRDRMDLSPGDYDVSVVLLDRDGSSRRLRSRVSAPADGVVRVMLRE